MSSTGDLLRGISKGIRKKDFEKLDAKSLSLMGDKDLAAWHAKYPSDSAQFILASNEWNRRLVVRQIKSARFIALAGIIGIVIGVVLGWMLSSYDPPFKTNKNEQKTED